MYVVKVMVVVVVYAVLKVVNLEDESFNEQINLRLRDTANLSYSAIDVAWGSGK
jgi:hypothetical protein